ETLAVALGVTVDVDREPLVEDRAQPAEVRGRLRAGERAVGAAGETVEPAGVGLDLRPARFCLPLLPAERGGGEEPTEIPVTLAALDEEPEETRARDRHLGADERPEAGPACGLEEAGR